jgi:ABC-2 type transport system permease protein
MNARAFLQMAIAQATILRRTVTFWLISIFIAALSMLVFGLLFKPEAQAFDLAVVDEDGSEASQSLSSAFASVENVKFQEGSRSEELGALKDGDRGAVIIIPGGFAADLANEEAGLEVYYDNSNLIRIGYVTSTVKAVVDSYNEGLAGRQDAVRLEQQAIETQTVRFIDFLTPGMVGMTIMFTNLAVGFLMVSWREQGILRRLGVTPLRPAVLIASQAASFSLVSVAQVAIILLIGRFAFNVHMEGSYLWLAVSAGLGILCMLSLGYTIASFAREVTSFSAAQQLLAFPMLFLGRSYFPIDPSPELAPIVQAVPLTHLNDALRAVVNHGGGVDDLWVSWLVLAAWTVGGFLVSMRLFRWQ